MVQITFFPLCDAPAPVFNPAVRFPQHWPSFVSVTALRSDLNTVSENTLFLCKYMIIAFVFKGGKKGKEDQHHSHTRTVSLLSADTGSKSLVMSYSLICLFFFAAFV